MSSDYVGRFWRTLDDGRIECFLCPRECRVRDGQRAFCFVRQNIGGEMVLSTYGRSSGFCIDPIEKKPLNHFYVGTPVLSFGTAGCNLGCKFCQNWDISKAREFDRLQADAGPEAIADAAVRAGCTSVAYTYNDPVIFAEYAIDTRLARSSSSTWTPRTSTSRRSPRTSTTSSPIRICSLCSTRPRGCATTPTCGSRSPR
jgi:pyruvate formate lyase activating enzyme